MCDYIGLDVSLKETAISVRRGGRRVWRGKCPSDPAAVSAVLRRRAPDATRVVFETGPLLVWFFHVLSAEGLPAICIDARHAKAALDMAPNKTDANDADGLAHLAEIGFYREVRVKGYDSMLVRTLVAARRRLVRISTELSNQIRGLMKAFGRRCCTTLIVEDSHCESMRLDGRDEQAITRPLPHDELVQLHGVASEARVAFDLAGQGHVLAGAA